MCSRSEEKYPKNSIVTRKINFLSDFRVLPQLLTTTTTTSSVTFTRILYAKDDVVFASHLSADENRIEWQMISEKCDICAKRIHA